MQNPKRGSAIAGTLNELRLQLSRLQADVRTLKKQLRQNKQHTRLKGRAAEAAAFHRLQKQLAREEAQAPHGKRRLK